MYKVKLVYSPEPRTQTLKESITSCASIELLQQYQIECYQLSASVLAFERESERTIAIVHLSSSTSFTALCID